jgi:hypothetical protein
MEDDDDYWLDPEVDPNRDSESDYEADHHVLPMLVRLHEITEYDPDVVLFRPASPNTTCTTWTLTKNVRRHFDLDLTSSQYNLLEESINVDSLSPMCATLSKLLSG